MDFYHISQKENKDGSIELYPSFRVGRSKDLMIRSQSFYAIWDEAEGLWSTDEYDVVRLIDEDLQKHKEWLEKKVDVKIKLKLANNFTSGVWKDFKAFMKLVSNSSTQLDSTLAFSNTKVKKSDHVSKRLPYPLEEGEHDAWDEIISTLYDPEEQAKLEWAIGAIVAGDAKHIQKFLVLYGPPGSGKGTIINIILKLFVGYYTTFEAKALGSNNGAFATEAFKTNPLVAIQHDGDLSKIEDNTLLNSIISHEEIRINEKFKPSYDAFVYAFLFMGTNKPVKISDAKSGIIRRLIDVIPSGRKLSPRRYQALMSQVDFELGAIAMHCLSVYREMGKHYYETYRPVEMMLQTDVFYNYIETNYDVFRSQDGTTLTMAYSLYKRFCEETLIEYKLPQHKFREELRNYFEHFEERAVVDGVRVRSWYSGFKTDSFKIKPVEDAASSLSLDETTSIFDDLAKDWPAQYAKQNESPEKAWDEISTTLADLDTSKLHYVRTPLNHIVIDFDLKDESGEKSVELNLAAASQWPPTYTEYSKGGGGVHLHYDYDGDVSQLSVVYSEGIEVKVFKGKSSLRRRFTKGNNIPVARINSGLPLKEKKVINAEQVKSERALRELITKNLRKEILPGTKPSMDFIKKILDDAYATNLSYDVTDMRGKILAFANNSQNNAIYCLKLVGQLKYKSADVDEPVVLDEPMMPSVGLAQSSADDRIVFFDVEVFPNLFMICWKYEGSDQITTMINPTQVQVEELFRYKLVGFNNRKYDNHIIYAASLGYSNEQLYKLSQKIVTNVPGSLFGAAYEISWADIFDFSSEKKSLKKWEIELDIPHKELGLPWDEPVPPEQWELVAQYCRNDVQATDDVFQARRQDYVARQILADMSGLSINGSTSQHAARIIFEGNRKPQDQFNYTQLAEQFEGYEYGFGKSTYRGEEVGEGGYVYAEPGMYKDVALLDIASMHPTSIKLLDLFGPYTKNFWDLVEARLAIKRGQFDEARKMLDGKLAKHLGTEEEAEKLSGALKIVINSVYGLTGARFDSPFKDPRNKDNIVAKRGALFMIDLKHAVQEKGFVVAHIKTDSIKIPDATPEIIEFVMEFGESYGYTFEHEATYERMCLVNNAVYIAKVAPGRKPGYWQATGAEFQHPYVFKTLFSKEPLQFKDMCETKSVTTALYLDFTEDQTSKDKEAPRTQDLKFVGKVGLFTPVVSGGGLLVREKDGKYFAATGSKGYLWMESHQVEELGNEVDMRFFDNLVNDALTSIEKFGDPEWLRGEDAA